MNPVKGRIVLLPASSSDSPTWWSIVDGAIVARTSAAISADGAIDAGPVMLVLPPGVACIRRMEIDPAMPIAQARAVALRQALAAGIEDAADMHGVVIDGAATVAGEGEGSPRPHVLSVAVISRADMAHYITWAKAQGVTADIIIPIAVLMPDPKDGFVRTRVGTMDIISGQGVTALVDEPWVQSLIGDEGGTDWPNAEAEAMLVAALEKPPGNLRTGAFALRSDSGVDRRWVKYMAVLAGVALVLSLGISVAQIIRYHASAASLDAQTVEMAKPYAPDAVDAVQAAGIIDRAVAEQGGAYAFSGPLSGLMNAMRPVPEVSMSAFSLGDDRLFHATLAAARAEDINAVLLAVQNAGFKITATSSTDPGGRVIAEITVKP